MKKLVSVLCCVFVLSFFSCENDDNSTIPANEDPQVNINFEENFGTTITARFLGRVVNEQNEPIQGATIRVGNTITSTDLFGIFSIDDASAYEKFAYITAEKDGYILGSRALAPSASEVNRVEIMLLKEDVIATISTGQEATVNLSNGTEVTFEGSFTKADGSAYNGEVKVILKHLSPDDDNMEAMMPGMLFAQDANGAAVALETYGMLAVELKSGSGEELQLAEGSTSQISMPLAANASNPPATIPLWHFDEVEGYWVEEGEATLQGNKYVGDVSHFSFWNYDYPYPSVYLCIELQDENGSPMPYTPVDLYSSLLNSTGTYGYTNANGVECGLVPSGEELTVIVPGVSCDGESFTTTIGPFTTDTTTTITVIANDQNTTTLTGTFVTCDGENVTDGYMQLFLGDSAVIIPVTDGTFEYSVTYCGTIDYSIKGVDIANNQVTAVLTGTLSGDDTLDLGALSSCTGFVDTDGDGIFDSFEDVNGDNDLDNDDTDGDGIPNYQDEDDDGDGVNTADEDYDGDGDPTNDDSDGDQIPDYLDELDVVVFSAEVEGEGCDPVVFDLDAVVTEFGNDLHTYAFFQTEADAQNNTSPLGSSYSTAFANVINNGEVIFVRATNSITGQTDIGMLYLYVFHEDSDNDGLTDCEETTGIDNPATNQVPNGTSDPNDPNDPVVQPDTVVNVNNVTINESDGVAVVSINLETPSNNDTVMNVETLDETAISPDDYSQLVQTLTIPAGSQTATLTIPIIDDTLAEQSEFFLVYVTVTSGNTMNTNAEGLVTIVDDDTNNNYPTEGEISACIDPSTGIAQFDLTSMDLYYTNGNANGIDLIVSYHLTEADALNGTNALVSPYGIVDNVNLFVRIEEFDGGITISLLLCNPQPVPNAPTGLSLTVCDGNGDGFGEFNLEELDDQIVQGQGVYEVTYYETLQDADADVNPLPFIYTNISDPQTIFYRVYDINTGCYATGSIDLIVDAGC